MSELKNFAFLCQDFNFFSGMLTSDRKKSFSIPKEDPEVMEAKSQGMVKHVQDIPDHDTPAAFLCCTFHFHLHLQCAMYRMCL